MQFEPLKERAGRYLRKSAVLRKIFYSGLDLLLLRSWHLHKALRSIRKTLPEDASVLDAGSGLGQHSWYMAKKNKGWKIKGIDIIKQQADDCNKFFNSEGLGERVNFESGDLTGLNEKEAYDLIISVDVMEHIENDRQVFRNFWFALKPGGTVLITTPSNKDNSGKTETNAASFASEHVRSGYGTDEISEKLNEAGFSKLEIKYTYGWPGHLSWLLSIKYPAVMIEKSKFFFIILVFYFIPVLPIVLMLNIFDTCINHKTGTGLLITAYK
ncbi:MAG TPA: class I SAM-dependent methyltransferase [Bacteroidales bacterium]|nr:methyltransferase type 11 [Bacteroidales bacterium]HQG36920.1 class I SAM-dependent methyltransferase [Bacteroidales bacterium]HRC88921.1 class I SAM-dependent methyltransferase [Bacteroidales bacterium]